MTNCRYDRNTRDYLTPDGTPCRIDDYGDPTRHCTAQTTCNQHIGPNDQTCARCLGRTRNLIRRIPDLATLMDPVAATEGVNSQAAVLAGPAADYEIFSARRAISRRWITTHLPRHTQERAMLNLLDDDDEDHPLSVLGRWAQMTANAYHHETPAHDVSSCAAYLDRQLARIAQDPEQDFAGLSREVRKCRRRMESVLATARHKERGAPCPECTNPDTGVGPRLVREYGHWCEDPDCCQEHHPDDRDDLWVCPKDRKHAWTPKAYEQWIAERKGRTA